MSVFQQKEPNGLAKVGDGVLFVGIHIRHGSDISCKFETTGTVQSEEDVWPRLASKILLVFNLSTFSERSQNHDLPLCGKNVGASVKPSNQFHKLPGS